MKEMLIRNPERPRGNLWFQDLRWRLSEEAAQASGVRNAQAMFSAFVVLVSMVGAGAMVLVAWLAR